MLSVILSACLIADPEQCRDFKIQVDFKMPAKYCTVAAQPVQLARHGLERAISQSAVIMQAGRVPVS